MRLKALSANVGLIAACASANPYFPQGADAEAIREALLADTSIERTEHLSRVSDQSIAAIGLLDILRSFDLVDAGKAHEVRQRISDAWKTETKELKSGKPIKMVKFPPYREYEGFDTHRAIGTYEGGGKTVQLVGLPADGFFAIMVDSRFWKGDRELVGLGVTTGETSGRGKLGKTQLELEGATLRITGADGKVTELSRTAFESPTMGISVPEGGTELITKSGEPVGLVTEWKTVDNALEITGGPSTSQDPVSGKIHLHVEFRVPNNPGTHHRARGNSGVFLGPYEIQINDNFGFEIAMNHCGGMYHFAPPLKNASLPPGTWQTFDAVFSPDVWSKEGTLVRDARITIYHNGELIHDETVLKYSDSERQARKKSVAEYNLSLQDRGNRLQFRNFWWAPAE